MNVVGRLAPSPTGALHLGNARSFLIAWLSARQQSGKVVLRIEDIDSPRVKAGAVRATIDDLNWLGLDWDFGPSLDGSNDGNRLADLNQSPSFEIPFVQTQRLDRYREVLATLIRERVVYPCVCSRSDVAAAASAPHDDGLPCLEGQVYPGTCRSMSDRISDDLLRSDSQLSLALGCESFAWRWKMNDERVTWQDELKGTVQANPSKQLGDFVIARSNGTPAYQLAVVIDDFDMGITEVVRGDDLIFSTFRQLAILRFLRWDAPIYYHVPLIVGSDGRRLAKRHGDTRLSFFRDAGISSAAVVGYLAFTAGILSKPEAVQVKDLVGELNWAKVPKEPTVFDLKSELRLLKTL